MYDLTRDYARAYDSVREAIGMQGPLKLIALASGTTGYAPVLTVAAGWKAKRVTRHALGQEFFEIKIADIDSVVESVVKTQSPTHVLIGELYYKVSGVEAPKTVTRKWLIRCSPTGERKAA
jgi:hypothetical protein